MSTPKIVFDLIDGFVDKDGTKHTRVVMSPLTPQIQIELRGDTRITELKRSTLSTNSPNAVERAEAFGELQQYYCILFGKTVESIGGIDRQRLLEERIIFKLSNRDVGVMILNQNGEGGTLVRYERIREMINASPIGETDRIALLKYLDEQLGETPAASAASAT